MGLHLPVARYPGVVFSGEIHEGTLVRKLVYVMVALVPAVTLLFNHVAWAFHLSGTYETHIEHVGSVSSIPWYLNRHADGSKAENSSSLRPLLSLDAGGKTGPVQADPISVPDSRTFHSSQVTLRPKLKYRAFSLAGEYVIRLFDRKPRPLIPFALEPDSFPALPPFESYYRWSPNPPPGPQVASGQWKRFWGSLHLPGFDILAGAKNTPFGISATLGSDITNDIMAVSWSTHNFHVTLGTGLWISEASTDRFSIIPPAPWNALLLNSLSAGSYLSKPERKTETRCKKREKTWGFLDTIVLAVKLVGWLAGLGEPSGEKEDSEDSRKWYSDSSETSNSRDCWKRCDCDDDDEYEYYDCHDVVVYDPTPAEIRAARVDGLARLHKDRADVNKPFAMLLVRGDFPYFSAGIGGVWFPILRRRLPGGAPNLNPDHHMDDARLWLTYLHYKAKRFFAKAEYSALIWNAYPNASSHQSRRGYHCFAEVGTHRGPFKVSLMAALASGIDRPGLGDTDRSAHFPIHHQALALYESLMFHRYGGGNLAFHGAPDDGKGMLSDAYALGARLDYSAAANLNLWTSALWAHRLGNSGVKFGQFAPSGLLATESQRRLFAQAAGRALLRGPDDYGYVSDGALGYEFNMGADWRVSSYLNVALQAALWQPGAWFKEAHQGVGPVRLAYGVTLCPLETRPAVYGLSASVTMEF